ncbi:ATP-binding cassette sub-family A member 1, partial [Orchesella cincta]
FKMIQRMAGMPSWVYWLCHGIGDIILYACVVQICFAIVYFFDYVSSSQFNFQEKAALWRIFMSWLCWAGIPYSYLVSQVINAPEAGYGYYILIHFCLGKCNQCKLFFVVFTSRHYSEDNHLPVFPPIYNQLWILLACDLYENITKSLWENDTTGTASTDELKYVEEKVDFSDSFRTCCKKYCELAGTCLNKTTANLVNILFETDEDATLPGLHHDMWALLLNGLVCWVLVILVEKQLIQNVYSFFSYKLCGNLEKAVASRDTKTSDEPEDVKDEHQKVDYMVEVEGDVDSEVYLVQDVTKFYKYTKGLDHVYFSVPRNAITGLLGLPKSGKTTIIEVLTSQCSPSAGSYLLQYLTGAQMMTIMGRIRGLTSSNCEEHVAWWLEEFGLKDVANFKCENYRKGQKRRLCCAMSLIGDCDMTIFDEPTVFMDSLEQYLFWNIVKRLPANKRTVLFSSIDAEEVQRQSSKVLVLDSGVLVAVGQLTDIFKNNKQGMFLLIRYGFQAYRKYTNFQKKAKLDKLRDHIIQYLSPCALTDEQENLLIYHLKDVNMKLSRVYAVMEGAKVRFSSLLEHFQVSEPSLDDIVLQFHKSRNKRRDKSIVPVAADDKVNTSDSQKIPTLASTVGQWQ